MIPLPCAPSFTFTQFRGRIQAVFHGADSRTCAAFWLFGLINNVLYVIILSAALDLVGPSVPKGVVLLADVIPSFVTKLCAPYFIHLVPYPIRILIFVALSAGGMLLIALSPAHDPSNMAENPIFTKMCGVILASLSSGGGELSFLGLTHFYGHFSLAAWSSGTGAAGLVGAGAYALATTSFGFTVRATLLASACLPAVMVLSFFVILPLGPLRRFEKGGGDYQPVSNSESSEVFGDSSRNQRAENEGLLSSNRNETISAEPQSLSWKHFKANLKRAKALFFPFMLPLLLVYIAEYTINQGVAPTLLFPLESSPFEHFRSFYPTYNAIYQVGVFISRSSTPFFRVHDLYFPSFLQLANLAILTLQALFNFIPNVYVIFIIVFWEGLLGGLVYVNTFAEITDRVPEEDREFSLGATTVSDSGDHVLGRPSTQMRKIQVFAVVGFWILYLVRGNKHGPPGARFLSSRLNKRMTPWQATVMTMLTLYLSRNFAKLVGLECPEPLANLYSRSYFRATWVTTALDAGFWTAMNIKRKWLRDLASFIFTIYYLIAAEHADEKVRKVRAVLTVDHLRVSWNKATTPYLSFFSKLLRPRLCKYDPIAIRIPRPRESSYKEPTSGWLFFNGPLSSLRNQDTIVLDIPGGGFVAMDPRTSDDKLLTWAGKTGIPVLSLDYKKAPEHPYPYALNECYDVYHTIVMTKGRCIGLSGKTCPRIILTGDSAGGNLAAGLTLMILQAGSTESRKWRGEGSLPVPAGLILIYPSLDMNIGNWMTDEQMSLIRDRGMRKTNQNILRRKSEDYYKLTTTPHPSDDALENHSVLRDYFDKQHGTDDVEHPSFSAVEKAEPTINKPIPGNIASQIAAMADKQPHQIRTRLAVSSMISYFNDRILTPEMMRAMIILYIGPYNRPDFSTDFLLSPLLAPEALLAKFPKTYFLTGERDPLVDDTVIFAGRIRQAKLHRFRERQELGLEKSKMEFDEKDHVEVTLIPGISHGFLNFVTLFPEGWKQLYRCTGWIQDIQARATVESIEKEKNGSTSSLPGRTRAASEAVRRGSGVSTEYQTETSNMESGKHHHYRSLTGESSVDEDGPLEMSIRMTGTRSGSSSSAHSSSMSNKHDSSPATEALDDAEAPGSKALRSVKPVRKMKIRKVGHPTLSLDQEKRAMQISRETSLTSLPSEEDLLHRRMKGLAGGLMGIGEEARTP
ncbi:hypothetical protein LOZ61_002274 [Ophidiomyces ophidiicola]|uniref:Uncharacterized protein n=1 Tax=Ophidiomyces ophidiicola TaxID=1387563 RepID=A0ACB8UX61_9EURO|nr:hypothetical protein LOZ61_002274 [Ophidiomyces ophidiicola]KAI1927012.1 hypothetical protein LOZ64_000146 [Ophidiomyces ophidiicola]KAI1929183.1 hypothetical protein LOZ60_001835 [Ophidiomyces ophidiicola]KAI1963606.1 hypothetical protein LOZ59_001807 [Ophidiomyces ophidiicola]KAI1974073.1 hypothetical protein LOZ56_001475 [Ophidiomyces ophidiicola]